MNGAAALLIHDERQRRRATPYPAGESWEQAVNRVGRELADLPSRWTGRRVLIIGHTATRWALDHLLAGARLTDLLDADFGWQPGWEYDLYESRWQ